MFQLMMMQVLRVSMQMQDAIPYYFMYQIKSDETHTAERLLG
jgi:hypothetical protein